MKSHPQKVHFPVAVPSTRLLLLPYASDSGFTSSVFVIMKLSSIVLFCGFNLSSLSQVLSRKSLRKLHKGVGNFCLCGCSECCVYV